ncbi:MAG: hypothetical protein WC600_12500 [Desulfobaccales bacterium]
MSTAFSFFLRLFLCFVGARFLLQAIDVEGRGYLVGLTILFLVNVYWFSYLVFRDRRASPAEAGNVQAQSPIDPAPAQAEPQEDRVPPQT